MIIISSDSLLDETLIQGSWRGDSMNFPLGLIQCNFEFYVHALLVIQIMLCNDFHCCAQWMKKKKGISVSGTVPCSHLCCSIRCVLILFHIYCLIDSLLFQPCCSVKFILISCFILLKFYNWIFLQFMILSPVMLSCDITRLAALFCQLTFAV